MGTRLRRLTSLALVLQAGCRGHIPQQGLSHPVAASTAAVSAADGRWVYRSAGVTRAYQLDQYAIVTTGLDSTTRKDTASLHAELAFAFLPSAARLTGSVTAFRVAGAGLKPSVPQGLTLPFAFSGDVVSRARQVVFTTPASSSPCAAPATIALQSLRDMWLQPPDTLRLLGSWEDTATYALCRDGVVLWANARRTFRVVSSEVRSGRVVVSIQRQSRGTLTGAGQQAGEPVTVGGSSSGQATYTVDPETGELLGAAGTTVLDLKLVAHQRALLARQVTEFCIRPRLVDKP
jgi:hypothetical protein